MTIRERQFGKLRASGGEVVRIVSIGECMVELAPLDNAGEFHLGYAGDTLNTAWYLRRLLGSVDQVDYFTAVGMDSVSDQMLDFLRISGIGISGILRCADKSVGLYMIHLQDGERSFAYWRSDSAARTLAADPLPLQASLTEANLAYFSGITLAILPSTDRLRFLTVLREFRKNGGVVAFDPNLRPSLWNSTEDMTQAVMQAAAVSDIVLPSFEDEARWFGDTNLQATVDRYAVAKVGCCVVKNGSERILAFDKGQLISCEPIQDVTVVDSTAAGDSFNAGFIAARLHGVDLHDAVQAGASLAAQVVVNSGALVDAEGLCCTNRVKDVPPLFPIRT